MLRFSLFYEILTGNHSLVDAPGEMGSGGMLVKWSSLDLLTEEDAESAPLSSFSDKGEGSSMFSGCSALKRTSSERARTVTNISCPGSPTLSVMSVVEGDHLNPAASSVSDSPSSCKISTLLLVVHAGSILGSFVFTFNRISLIENYSMWKFYILQKPAPILPPKSPISRRLEVPSKA